MKFIFAILLLSVCLLNNVHAQSPVISQDDFSGLYGFCDNNNGNTLVRHKYQEVRDFNEGLAWVKSRGKWGLINEKGEEVCPCRHTCEIGSDFSNGFSSISEKGKFGFINK